MKIAIYGKSLDANYFGFAAKMLEYLLEKKVEVFIYEPFQNFLAERIPVNNIGLFNSYQEVAQMDYLFSIGGDGTLLETMKFVRDSGVPILGINTGRLGFLTSVTTDQVEEAIDFIVEKNYELDKRSLLSVETSDNLFGEVNYALNEITLQKKDTSSMITIKAYLDGEYLNSYWADGLIISTPTGSTAYSLSCNGPIILPRSGNIIINPIAPHNLNVRPLVVPDDIELVFKVEGRTDNFLVALDSRSETIPLSSELKVKKSNHYVNIIRLPNYDFLNTLRTKLIWGMDKRN